MTGDSVWPVSIVVMGVSGAGKSTVAAALAERLGAVFLEGDSLHPELNIAKMAAGIALTDDDRGPWLDKIATKIVYTEDAKRSIVIACSSLRRSYRDRLRFASQRLAFAFLDSDDKLLLDRLSCRTGHFMPAALLASQLAALERPGQDESKVLTLDAMAPLEESIAALEQFSHRLSKGS